MYADQKGVFVLEDDFVSWCRDNLHHGYRFASSNHDGEPEVCFEHVNDHILFKLKWS
jgi:hypothetical protein